MDSLIVHPSRTPFAATVRLPFSKSLSNRALILATLSKNHPRLYHLSGSADTLLLKKLIGKIRSNIGTSGEHSLDCENAGTVFRFLTAFLSCQPGTWLLSGSERMKQRPIGPLADALNSLGARIEYTENPGFPPLRIVGTPFKGNRVTIDPGLSSQFVTALLLIAPTLPEGLEILFSSPPSSLPYIHMTLGMMEHFGVKSTFRDQRIVVKRQEYLSIPYAIEPDWSAASFWFETVALSNHGSVFLPGLQKNSLQGDARLPALFNLLGVKSRFEKKGLILHQEGKPEAHFSQDFTGHPDLLQPVLATCAGLGISGRFTGIKSLRIKETDRITAMVAELSKLGVNCTVDSGSRPNSEPVLRLSKNQNLPDPGDPPSTPAIDTHGDHRMAMAFAPLALRFGPLEILDPGVVVKSYPQFWEELKKAGIELQR